MIEMRRKQFSFETHQALLGRVPRLVAADVAFYSARNEAAAKVKGSNAFAFPIDRPRAPNATASRESVGSVTSRNGAPDARDASAWSSGDIVSVAAATGAMSE
jgi:hypothetical protein